MSRPTRKIIKLGALKANAQTLRALAPNTECIAMVKADAYGHGLDNVVKSLSERVDAFGVSCIEEALALRVLHTHLPILLFEGFHHPDELTAVSQHRLTLVIHHTSQIPHVLQTTLQGDIWLKVDTGMHRLGLHPRDVAAATEQFTAAGFKVHHMTHLACADDANNPLNAQQIQNFFECTAGFAGKKSLANSAGILAHPKAHADCIRPGLALYGISPFENILGGRYQLQPAMQLESAIMSIHQAQVGEAIGYGSTYVCHEPTVVGVVACGYGDGYPRHIPNETPVLIRGQLCPTIGRVSMDMLTVNLNQLGNPAIGEPVVLWGDGLPIETIATQSGTSPYELVCQITARPHHVCE